ncbi:serine/threonine-protein phosphatase 6 regulatory ankyrin repeat subunit B-like isoform X2 [Palaemon carinicauda]|uniref:serine/threonine-protein phosphatase 6 regulatory ankyrin repeat subunit B-like isoform X2 n=1 Tax=Palaemon carinicauda TaxID=392227 RepID=UPI0035B5F3AE
MGDSSYDEATQLLVDGVIQGDLEKVTEALKGRVDVNQLVPWKDGVSRPLLGLSAYLGHANLVAPLLSAGADVDGRCSREFTPLIHAAGEMRFEVIKELVKAGADINATTSSREVRNSVLHTSVMKKHVDAVTFLLAQEGLNVSPQDDLGYSPLHVASRINHIPIINLLVDAGADLNLHTIHGWTPLHIASMSGSLDAVKRLLELKFDIYAVDMEGRTPCHLADELGMIDVYWYFIKKAGQTEDTTLTPPQKCEKRYDIEKWLLEWANDGSDYVMPMLKRNQPDPFDGYYQDKRGYTTLHITAEKGNLKMVKMLLDECFMYPAVRDRKNRTPADLARANGHFDVAESIESYYPPQKTHEEKEALYLELLELIGQGDDVVKASTLLRSGAPIEPFGQHSNHALFVAMTANRRRILTLLLASGVPITTTFQGLNILQIPWISPHVSTFVRMIITRMTAFVLEEELSRVIPERDQLRAGISYLLEKVRSDTPWVARWPESNSPSAIDLPQHYDPYCRIPEEHYSSASTSANLTKLMVQAVQSNCTLTTAFLQQAGGVPFALDAESGESPFTTALKCHHWDIAHQIAKGTACLYIPDGSGILPRNLLRQYHLQDLEKGIFDKEFRKIDDEIEKAKENDTKVELQRIRELQRSLYEVYIGAKVDENICISHDLGAQALLLASQFGLSQLVHLLLSVAHLDVNITLETHMDTTALHQAAAFGHSDLCTLLISRGAKIDEKDRFHHTPPHFAAMFSHESAYQQLTTFMQDPNITNLSNNNPSTVRENFNTLLKQYNVLEDFLERGEDVYACNDPAEAEKKKLNQIPLSYVVELSHSLRVNFYEGEAAQVKQVVITELEKIRDEIAKINPIFNGELALLGSAADNTRLHAPDEFDFNFCVDMSQLLNLSVAEFKDKGEGRMKGHPKYLKVSSQDKEMQRLLKKSNWKDEFYKAVVECMKTHVFSNCHLSLVPPGITRTQVGVGLSFAWQGTDYPLLLIGIDLVPVLKAFCPKNLEGPYLTPESVSHVYISSIGNGEWRLSFANFEADILGSLRREELKVYLTCKTLLSCMKAEPWMPKAIKNKFTWWNSRRWKIPIPSGFALKNCFLRELEEKRKNKKTWTDESLPCNMSSIFKRMIEEEFYEVTGITGLVSKRISAYFGGEFEIPKLGEGSLEIIRYLEKYCPQ